MVHQVKIGYRRLVGWGWDDLGMKCAKSFGILIEATRGRVGVGYLGWAW